jgi:dihydroorotate dehydrogenase electron transfer subunit
VSGGAAAPHRGTIFLEQADVIGHESYPGEQYVLRLRAPRCAAAATPGSFIHLNCGPGVPMRRPLSIMRASAAEGWIEVLYKIVGHGLAQLALRKPGEALSCLGPIGRGFATHADKPRTLMIGGGVGIPPMVFLAETLAAQRRSPWKPLVLMGSELPFPFRSSTSTINVPGMPPGATAGMPLLEDCGVPSRLASHAGFPGCHAGHVTDLARIWIASLAPAELAEVEIFACGPEAMLRATATLARSHGLPCQVSLEEYMACAVGGCAGCTVLVQTPAGPAMKRVCVDGPVFDAATVFTT